MTDSSGKGVSIRILDKEYTIACSNDERHDLLRSADFLDKKMREIRDSGKIVGSDRIAVMAALNISHELLSQGGGVSEEDPMFSVRIRSIQEKIDDALTRSNQLDAQLSI
ncbi:MAG: cell division protein ZapA [Woeseiaceae bacterium]